ncbi:UNKNOWN [Stylonychia lemnae]|uniref:Morn repeat protein n=1 Tax=Stylonychia lemnae TaxID=5949 RepID=A0A078B4F7_STYLE|nr:UNKNOWN [Stylonychia lemnae]|eukprot:CDW89395.1 UNKNOWN [Stylonychia lemnae]
MKRKLSFTGTPKNQNLFQELEEILMTSPPNAEPTIGSADPTKSQFQFNRAFDQSHDLVEINDFKPNNDDEFNLLEEYERKTQNSDGIKNNLNQTFENLQTYVNNPQDPNLKQILEEYQPESAEIDLEELKQSNDFYIKKYPDAVYFGECVKSSKGKLIRQGKGIMKYQNSRVYEGEWLNDQRHGRGFEHYPNGNIYQGEFENGKAHGQGHYSWVQSGEVYDGQWQKGIRHGKGVWKRQNKNSSVAENGIIDSYVGEWKNGKADGFGVHTWSNGDQYEGEWKACMKHGKGVDLFANGDSYNGMYKDGKPHGEGKYVWTNGSYYEGTFRNGLKHGFGKWKKYVPNVNGQQATKIDIIADQLKSNFMYYEGDYKNDKKDGKGHFVWPTGNYYKGDYKDDEREGNGEMKWIDGTQYVGSWIRGVQHGYGKIIMPDGTMKEGYFENNIFLGTRPRTQGKSQEGRKINKLMRSDKKDNLNNIHDKDINDIEDKYKNMISLAQQSGKNGNLASLEKLRSRSQNMSQQQMEAQRPQSQQDPKVNNNFEEAGTLDQLVDQRKLNKKTQRFHSDRHEKQVDENRQAQFTQNQQNQAYLQEQNLQKPLIYLKPSSQPSTNNSKRESLDVLNEINNEAHQILGRNPIKYFEQQMVGRDTKKRYSGMNKGTSAPLHTQTIQQPTIPLVQMRSSQQQLRSNYLITPPQPLGSRMMNSGMKAQRIDSNTSLLSSGSKQRITPRGSSDQKMYRDRSQTQTQFYRNQESLQTLQNERDREANNIKALINSSSSGYLLNRYDQIPQQQQRSIPQNPLKLMMTSQQNLARYRASVVNINKPSSVNAHSRKNSRLQVSTKISQRRNSNKRVSITSSGTRRND